MKVIFIILLTFTICNYAQCNGGTSSIKRRIQALQIVCNTRLKLDFLLKNYQQKPGYDFATIRTDVNNTTSKVLLLIPANEMSEFKVFLNAHHFNYTILDDNAGKTITEYLEEIKHTRNKRSTYNDDILDSFPGYDEIMDYLKNLEKNYPDKIKYLSIGKSSENRDIAAVKISSGGQNKSSMIIDAGIHACEWIAPTTALYAIKALVEDPSNSYIFKNVVIYVIPVLNPDGYVYSHLSNETRLWRKSRSFNPKSPSCFGVDLNRNFDFMWGGVGSSKDPCSLSYAGVKAFSEPETVAFRNFTLSLKNIQLYLSLHSSAQLILYPPGLVLLPFINKKELNCIATEAKTAIEKVRGTIYNVGTIVGLLYPTSGGSIDWAVSKGNITSAFLIELPAKVFGFIAPISEIKPIGNETFEAIKIFAKYAENKSCIKP